MTGLNSIYITQGSLFSLSSVVHDATGALVNIGGYTGQALLKYKYSETGAIVNFTITTGSAVSGAFTLSLDTTQSTGIKSNVCLYEAEFRSGANAYKPVWGYAYITPELIR